MKKSWKTIGLVAVPLVVAYVMNRLLMLGMSSPGVVNFVGWLFAPLSLVFTIFWVWVGSKFASLDIKKVYSFLLGNSLNIIACTIYVWLFYWSEPATRFTFGRLSTFAQFYALPVVNLGSRIVMLFTNHIDGSVVMVVSYLLLTLAFSTGFIYRARKDAL